MARVADEQTRPVSTRDGADATVADLAVEMRGAVTPVIGYLELISDGGETVTPDQHLDWIATIERRLEAVRELHGQIERVCAVLKESATEHDAELNGREAAMPRGPEAPEG